MLETYIHMVMQFEVGYDQMWELSNLQGKVSLYHNTTCRIRYQVVDEVFPHVIGCYHEHIQGEQ